MVSLSLRWKYQIWLSWAIKVLTVIGYGSPIFLAVDGTSLRAVLDEHLSISDLPIVLRSASSFVCDFCLLNIVWFSPSRCMARACFLAHLLFASPLHFHHENALLTILQKLPVRHSLLVDFFGLRNLVLLLPSFEVRPDFADPFIKSQLYAFPDFPQIAKVTKVHTQSWNLWSSRAICVSREEESSSTLFNPAHHQGSTGRPKSSPSMPKSLRPGISATPVASKTITLGKSTIAAYPSQPSPVTGVSNEPRPTLPPTEPVAPLTLLCEPTKTVSKKPCPRSSKVSGFQDLERLTSIEPISTLSIESCNYLMDYCYHTPRKGKGKDEAKFRQDVFLDNNLVDSLIACSEVVLSWLEHDKPPCPPSPRRSGNLAWVQVLANRFASLLSVPRFFRVVGLKRCIFSPLKEFLPQKALVDSISLCPSYISIATHDMTNFTECYVEECNRSCRPLVRQHALKDCCCLSSSKPGSFDSMRVAKVWQDNSQRYDGRFVYNFVSKRTWLGLSTTNTLVVWLDCTTSTSKQVLSQRSQHVYLQRFPFIHISG